MITYPWEDYAHIDEDHSNQSWRDSYIFGCCDTATEIRFEIISKSRYLHFQGALHFISRGLGDPLIVPIWHSFLLLTM